MEHLETIYPGQAKSWNENGIRKCEYYLNDSFIKCESETKMSSSGKKRYYAYLINYDKKKIAFGLLH